MDYIDEMYRQMLAAQGRMPASGPDMTPYSQQNVTPGWLNPQKQEKTIIEARPPEPIEYPTGYKVQVPQSEIIRENVNEALKSQMAEKQALAGNVKDIYGEREGYKKDLSSALERMRGLSESSYEAPEVDAQIKMYQQKMMEPKESVAPRDTMAELILTLGPALGGLVGGESGALAAPAAGKASRDIYEYQRKEEIDRVKNLKDSTEKKLKTLIDLKKSGQESFDKSAERGLGRIKAELEATKSLATMSNDDLKRTEDNLLKLNESIAKETGSKAVDIAKMEMEKGREAEKTKRANIIASGQGLKEATVLRKEFNAEPIIKNFKDIEQSYQKMVEISKKPSAAGDISMIFSYMRMLDPTSTVREGEFATAQQAGGIPDRIVNTYNKLVNGERLSPDQRRDFINQAENIYKSQQSLASRIESDYIKMAPSYGANPSLVVPRKSEQIKKVFDKDVLDYAKKYKITPEQALSIKEKRAK